MMANESQCSKYFHFVFSKTLLCCFLSAKTYRNTSLHSDPEDMLLVTNEVGVAPYPKIYDLGEASVKDKAWMVDKFGKLHINFEQNGDESGVDPDVSPVGVDERMILLPRPDQKDIPWYWFFYMGGTSCF